MWKGPQALIGGGGRRPMSDDPPYCCGQLPEPAGSVSHTCSSAHSNRDGDAGFLLRLRRLGLTGPSAMNSAQETSASCGSPASASSFWPLPPALRPFLLPPLPASSASQAGVLRRIPPQPTLLRRPRRHRGLQFREQCHPWWTLWHMAAFRPISEVPEARPQFTKERHAQR